MLEIVAGIRDSYHGGWSWIDTPTRSLVAQVRRSVDNYNPSSRHKFKDSQPTNQNGGTQTHQLMSSETRVGTNNLLDRVRDGHLHNSGYTPLGVFRRGQPVDGTVYTRSSPNRSPYGTAFAGCDSRHCHVVGYAHRCGLGRLGNEVCVWRAGVLGGHARQRSV